MPGLAARGAALGRDLCAAPDGSPQADGSQDKPLDLNTVFSEKSPVKPGDTIYLKGGRYDGPMGKTDSGVSKSPATRSGPRISSPRSAPPHPAAALPRTLRVRS
jgi:hypothetical protein